jgi:predicted GH43/DUF377 family glycosyl hydrolase
MPAALLLPSRQPMHTRDSRDRDEWSRRSFLAGALGLAAGRALPDPTARYATPFKLGRLVLSASPEASAFDGRSVDCPFVFAHGRDFFLAYAGYDGVGYQTGLAASRDLVEWRRVGCILRRDPASPITRHNVAMNWIVRDNALRSAGELKKIRGRFLGAWHAYPNAGYESGPAVIGLCWSEDLLHWELEAPCLRPEDGAAWERGGLYKPCLVERKGTYYLFYNAKTAERRWREQIGVAVSTDLKTWRRHDGNPIIANGGAGSPDERFASDPCVLLDGKTWAILYYGLDAKGRARDLIALGKDPYHPEKLDDILIDVGPPGAVDETYAHKPSVIWHEGVLYHFYCAVSGKYPNEVRGISVARSRMWS